ncbi:RDD family protein [Quadrisphaera sp. DSM 44207]|uniref:RDD family protein n=1 Tax=Quadrisphaera sp. DSM 44207 TaxID=1881057 RepID=UPI000880A0D6|nr:RDD family protein [Quadrisphaera sp. DSM 44207]SDQ09253.1 Uncharacterized membrane protein YckC, RDD family [Quadrisphaera sp. DSM 44207]
MRSGDDALVLPGEVVTGEAVLLDLRPASFLPRALALAVDVLVLAAVGAALALLVGLAAPGLDVAALSALALAATVGVLVVLPAAWEALSRGRSPGKAALGLRVVRDDGGPVRARHAAVRALVGFGEIWLAGGSAAVICSLVHPQGKRIGDLLAGTRVVRTRAARQAQAPLLAPPQLAAWAASADIGRLPDALAVSARQLLARADGLHPASRARLLEQAAAAVLARVAPPPPAGSAPEAVLAAVLAERRDRELVRLRRQREQRDAVAEDLRRLQGL